MYRLERKCVDVQYLERTVTYFEQEEKSPQRISYELFLKRPKTYK